MEEKTQVKAFSKEWFSDPKNIVITIVGATLICCLLYAFAVYVLPWLTTVVWNLVNLIIGAVVCGVLLIIFTSKKFWRSIKYLSELIGRYTLGLVIEMNPFNIIEMKIEQAEKDRAALKKKGDVVSGKKIELETKVKTRKDALSDCIRNADTLKRRALELSKAGDETEATLHAADYEVQAAKVTQLRNYIEALTPIVQDLGFLENHYKKVYKLCGTKIEIAKSDLELGRDQYESVMSGAGVAAAAWKALVGNDDLNRDAELAASIIQRKVSNSLAEMKNTMELTNDIIRSIERDNFTRAKEGMDLIRQMQTDGITEYIPTSKSDLNPEQFKTTTGYTNLLLEEINKDKKEE